MPPLLPPRGRRVTASSLPFGVASRVGKFDNCDPASLVAFAASGARRGAAAAGPRCVGFLYSAMPWRLPAADSFVAYQGFAPSARKLHGDKRTKGAPRQKRSEEHTSELQSLMRISYAVFCFKKKIQPS